MATTATSQQTSAPSGDGSAVFAAHVIHLDRATSRRAIMQAEFDRVGFPPFAWGGCDASAPAEADRVTALPDAGPWGPMIPHAKGCLLSHLDAMARFLESDATHALIIEDDVHLADDLALWMQPADWWPAGADLVKLERWRDDKLQVLLDKTGQTFAGRDLRRLRSRHSGTGGYVITREGAAAVLAYPDRNLPIDHYLFNVLVSPLARQLVTYQVNPALVVQGNEPEAPPATTQDSPRQRKSLGHKIKRGLAELRALRALPRLLTGQSRLYRISWQNRAHSA